MSLRKKIGTIGIIGHVDHGKTALTEAIISVLQSRGGNVGIITNKQLSSEIDEDFSKVLLSEPCDPSYILPYVAAPKFAELFNGKEFICKGKHQYRKVYSDTKEGFHKGDWVCKCGREL